MNSIKYGGAFLNAIGSVLIIIVVALFLYPTFTPTHHPLEISTCQSNLKQIGNAFKMYLSEWDNTYPTNRSFRPNGSLGPIDSYVKLSPAGDNTAREPIKFKYGLNWVEALYPYTEAVVKKEDAASVWWCPEIEKNYSKSDSTKVSYVMNRNLVEQKEKIMKRPDALMLCREMDRFVDAELRPTNDTRWTGKHKPISPFLTTIDAKYGKTEPVLHRQGSHILFADGHVRIFDAEAFTSIEYDPQTRCWYNHAPKQPANDAQQEAYIKITP